MSASWSRRNFPPRRQSKPTASSFFLLDLFSVRDIHKWNERRDEILKFHWDYYSDLAYQRSKIRDAIKRSLLGAAEKAYKFSKWQRVIFHKYSLIPLSVEGSLIDPGGRFNIGDINPAAFPPFPALYIAADMNAARQEKLSQKIEPGKEQKAFDAALADSTSMTNVSLSGCLGSIINLNAPEKLKEFIGLVKDFDLSGNLQKAAREIGLPPPSLIKTVNKLVDALLAKNWREWPMQFDVPSTSQIFGQMVNDAGIEGILYLSKFSGKDCLVIYPQNFDDASFVELNDEAPKETKILRLDAKVWKELQNR